MDSFSFTPRFEKEPLEPISFTCTFASPGIQQLREEIWQQPSIFDLTLDGVRIGTNGRLDEETLSVTFDWTPEGLDFAKSKGPRP